MIIEEAEPKQLIRLALRRVQVRFKEPVNPEPLAQVADITLLAESNGRLAHLQVEGEMDGLIKALAVSLVFATLAWLRFQRRDIRVGGEGSWQFALPWKK